MSSKRLPLPRISARFYRQWFQLTLLFPQTCLQIHSDTPFILFSFHPLRFFFFLFIFSTFKEERELLYLFHANLKRCFRISISLLAFHPSSKFYLSFFRETKYAKLITPVSLCKLSRTVKFNARQGKGKNAIAFNSTFQQRNSLNERYFSIQSRRSEDFCFQYTVWSGKFNQDLNPTQSIVNF